jgi:hypothetical protein
MWEREEMESEELQMVARLLTSTWLSKQNN